MKQRSSRREFIQTSLLAGAGLGLTSSVTSTQWCFHRSGIDHRESGEKS